MSSLKSIIIFIVLSVVLCFRIGYVYSHLPEFHPGQRLIFTTILSEYPKLQDNRQVVSVKTGKGMRVSITTGLSPLLQFGDSLTIDGVLRQRPFNGKNYWVMYFPKVQVVNSDQNIITSMANSIRNKAKTIYERTLPPVSASLALGMIFGGKQGMPGDFTEKLRNVSAIHVIAASGMNVSFVAGVLMYLFSTMMKRQAAILLSCFGIIFYMFIAGFEAPIVRAGIMAIIGFSAGILGRQYIGLLSVISTGYFMLLFNPLLLTDIGFQLSFLSTLGILLIQPLMPIKRYKMISTDIWTTISAQIATIPIMFGVLGSYGLLSVLVNALILWTVPIIMTLGSLALIVGLFLEPLGRVILYITLPFLWYFEKVVSFFGTMGWTLQTEGMPAAFIAAYYLFLTAVIIILNKRKKPVQPQEAQE